MTLYDPGESIVITNIGISETNVEISYIEKREQGESVGMMRTLFVDTVKAKLYEQLCDLLDSASEIVEGGLVALRNPEPQLDPRKRLGRGRVAKPEVDDDDGE